jgi:ferric-chelate reductase [NAD(P)H]
MGENNKIEMKAMFNLSYGLYIVSTVADEKLNGQVANAVMQVTGDPLCVTVCLNKANLTTDMIKKSGVLGVSVFEQDVPMTFIGQFGFKSGRDIDKFDGVNFIKGDTGAPMVTDWSLAVFEAKVKESIDIYTHTLFVGEVVSAKFLKTGTPLTYADYHLIKKGKSPKTAPTFGFNTLK